MNYEIVDMEQFSGSEAKIYSIIPEGEEETLFDKFIIEHIAEFKSEVKEISKRLFQIGHNTGAKEHLFKHEGDTNFTKNYGKYVWALYDFGEKKLRLYCIKIGNMAVILGGGGYKDKSVKKWQEDEKLSQEVTKIMRYAY